MADAGMINDDVRARREVAAGMAEAACVVRDGRPDPQHR
jgi:hypothetical protein